jgi:hypothetical protein
VGLITMDKGLDGNTQTQVGTGIIRVF